MSNIFYIIIIGIILCIIGWGSLLISCCKETNEKEMAPTLGLLAASDGGACYDGAGACYDGGGACYDGAGACYDGGGACDDTP